MHDNLAARKRSRVFSYIAIRAMMRLFIFFAILFIPLPGFSQDTYPGLSRIYSTENSRQDAQKEQDVFNTRLAQFIPQKERYHYTKFLPGRLIYSSHKEADVGKLNYDLLFQQISTIDIKGDTAFVANFEIIKYILLDKDLYYHDYQKGYFEILSNPDDTTRLVAQRKLKIIKREVLSDIEKPKMVSTIKMFSTIYDPLNPTFPREKVTLSREITFFLLNKNDEPIIATKAAFFKVFPSHKQEIEKYLSQMARERTPIKFYREADLKKLFQFCSGLFWMTY